MFAKPRVKKVAPPPPKKRKTTSAVEAVDFDFDARQDYLTGFHKRKVQRQKWAQEQAAKREREEKLEMRKQIRQERQREVEEHVQSVNTMLREAQAADSDNDQEIQAEDFEEWNGIEEEEKKNNQVVDYEDEYIDEDKFTTVKVEAVSVSRDGFEKIYESEDDKDTDEEMKEADKPSDDAAAKKKQWPKKEKKPKFRYELKLDRQNEARRQRAKKKARFKGKE